MAAVRPAGPDPMMMTSRAFIRVVSVPAKVRSGIALGPAERSGDQEDSAKCHPGRPGMALVYEHERSERADEQQDYGRDRRQHGEQPVNDATGDCTGGFDRAVPPEPDGSLDDVGCFGRPVAHSDPRIVPGPAAYMPRPAATPGGQPNIWTLRT